jgi:hypothetical protein
MGKLSIILVFAAILTGGTLVFNIQRTSLDTDSRLAYQQEQFFAREAAFAGMEIEMRERLRLVQPNINPDGFTVGIGINDVPYNGAFYSVTGTLGSCQALGASPANWDTLGVAPYNFPTGVNNGQIMDVTSVGRYGTGANATFHEVNGCFVVLNASSSLPPWSDYAFISNDHFEFNGGVSIDTINGIGNVHSNSSIDLGPRVRIAGNVTYVTDGDIKNGTQTASFQEGTGVSMEPFDPYLPTYIPDASLGHRVDNVTQNLQNSEIIAPPGWSENTVLEPGQLGTKENPFYWYIDGDLSISGNIHVRLPVYTIVVATGSFSVEGSASVTVSKEPKPESNSDADVKAWIESNLSPEGEGMLGWYVNGEYYLPNNYDPRIDEDTTGGVDLKGTGNFVGNIFTNGSFTLSGGGQGSNIVGSVAAYGTITGNGGGQGNNQARNFWYAGMADEIIHPGAMIPSNIISLVSISEWVDPVIKNTGGI